MNNSIIIYRSPIEQQAAEFWFNHPEYVVYAVYAGLAVAAIYCLYVGGQYLYNRFLGKKLHRKGRWS